MAIKLYNSLSHKLEEFVPIDAGEVKMYHCGPTVYDYIHLGNLRAFLLADILRRTFEYLGFGVRQVMNITDVGIGGNNDEGEDKILQGLRRDGKSITMENMKELGEFYTEKFKEDIQGLNIKIPNILPKASEHIDEQIELIKILENKGFAYRTIDGIYFDTSKDPHYGKLGLPSTGESRIAKNSEKRNLRDFALWKFNTNLGFSSLWGQGFPGWHIECSAMSMKYLGNTFDIHTGGIDLAPIHHNNEIAQSENACGTEFAHYWLHNEFVNVASGKMAKSIGNQINLKSIKEKSFSPLAYRYFLLMAHYRTPITFSWEALVAANNAYKKLKEFISSIPISMGILDMKYIEEFKNIIENDLNTPEAIAEVWKLVKDESVSLSDKKVTLLEFDKVLGLDLEHNEFSEVSQEIIELGKKRQEAKDKKDFETADKIRREIEEKGYEIRDSNDTFTISKK